MTIEEYLKKCQNEYKVDLDLPPNYSYPNGNQINTIVPICTAINKFMIIGKFPTAEFINGKIPFNDIDSTFSIETKAGKILDEMLSEIGVKRDDCWITNLVKVYLDDKQRKWDKFRPYAEKSMNWLYAEFCIANPKIVITLGEDVLQILKNEANSPEPIQYMIKHDLGDPILDPFGGTRITVNLNRKAYNIIPLRHPGYFLRDSEELGISKKDKWDTFVKETAPNAKDQISKITNL